MARKKTFFDGQPKLFTPSKIRGLAEGKSPILDFTMGVSTGSVQSVTSSFRYDPPGSPIKSTQQIPIDWSKFENHTFFNSAEAKVNTAFDVIINGYPFDGNRRENHDFHDELTGYENYVFDRFPKHRGYLNFSGSAAASGGSYIEVVDRAGNYSPELSRDSSGEAILDNKTKPITFDFHLHIPEGSAQQNQVLFQRLSGSIHGFTVAVQATAATAASGSLMMLLSSGSEDGTNISFLSSSMEVSKGDFQHVCLTYDSTPGVNRIKMYRNFKLQSTSSAGTFGSFGYSNASLLIGSGTNHPYGNFDGGTTGVSFAQTFSGSIDELRVYHEARSGSEQKKYSKQNVYPSDKLRLYFKFNEPTGSYNSNNVVIDSSGKSLHTTISNFKKDLREKSFNNNLASPLTLELSEENPVLFPTFPDVITLNKLLLTSASNYDTNNPNLITKLVPKHYFLEASKFEGFGQDKELGSVSEQYGSVKNFPGGGKLESAQIIASFLFVWAKFFDEMKIHLDHFGKLMHVDPVAEDSIGDIFLPFLASQYGVEIPSIFPDASLDQFTTRRGQKVDSVLSKNSLQYVQNQIWRRILSDLNEIMRSKGTIHSIKALMRNMGINPDQNFRFREYGGVATGKLDGRREKRVKVLRSLDFSGSFGPGSSSETSAQGVHTGRPFLKSAPLKATGSRIEPGFPKTDGNNPAYNNLITSASWTFEGLYHMTPHARLNYYHPQTSSLVRFSTSGSIDSTLKDSIYLNLLAFSGSNENSTTGSLSLVFRDTHHKTNAKKLVLPLTGVNIYDGDNWYVSFGRTRNDMSSSIASSSWFLRAGKQVAGSISQYYEATKLFDDSYSNSVLSTTGSGTTANNVSGSVFLIGTQSIPSSTDLFGLSYKDNALVNPMDRESFFGGKVLNIRFWSKPISVKEAKEHIRNPTSLGVESPKKNFNFVTKVSGSWERLRIDYDMMQEKTGSNSLGGVVLFDMTQNAFHGTGSGFEPSKRVIKPLVADVSTLSTHFDQASDYNKVRVRSFTKNRNIKNSNSTALKAPLYKIPEDEEPLDDTRFSIEISSVQALNEDIMNIFASLDAFDNLIGAPEFQFSDDYPDLEHLRDVYFNRLTKKLNIKEFFEFFKWFNMSFAEMIDLLVPRKTKFLGVNFIIEPHVLERPKMRYNTQDMYVGPNDRHGNKGTILLRQLVGEIKRY